MAKFNYKFAAVQRIKSTIEKKVQKELSTIDLEIEKTKKVINDLILEKKQRKEEVKSKKSLKVSELNFYESLEKNINAKIIIFFIFTCLTFFEPKEHSLILLLSMELS